MGPVKVKWAWCSKGSWLQILSGTGSKFQPNPDMSFGYCQKIWVQAESGGVNFEQITRDTYCTGILNAVGWFAKVSHSMKEYSMSLTARQQYEPDSVL